MIFLKIEREGKRNFLSFPFRANRTIQHGCEARTAIPLSALGHSQLSFGKLPTPACRHRRYACEILGGQIAKSRESSGRCLGSDRIAHRAPTGAGPRKPIVTRCCDAAISVSTQAMLVALRDGISIWKTLGVDFPRTSGDFQKSSDDFRNHQQVLLFSYILSLPTRGKLPLQFSRHRPVGARHLPSRRHLREQFFDSEFTPAPIQAPNSARDSMAVLNKFVPTRISTSFEPAGVPSRVSVSPTQIGFLA
jgi:hypothetical protein